jgi:putative peptide zinc metalloprotease protein
LTYYIVRLYSMNSYTPDCRVFVYPFVRNHDGSDIIIGQPEKAIFLVLPSDAVEILDCLASGKTVGEAQDHYQSKFNIVPDMEDFLITLEREGFIQPIWSEFSKPLSDVGFASASNRKSIVSPVTFHFSQFPQNLARLFFCQFALIVYGSVIVLALVCMVIDPSVIPGWKALLFQKDITITQFILLVIEFVAVFLHEMAHLIAARAVGVYSRIGIGNRMWMLVAETDMTGIWAVPRKQRYLPFLAGPLLDCVSFSMLIILFFVVKRFQILVPLTLFRIGQAVLFMYLLNLLWQCYLFVKTDLYYAIANFFNCKNLVSDTITFLRNQLAKVIPSIQLVDQSYVPDKEMRFIRFYAFVWIIGHLLALYVLFFVTLPLIYSYLLIIYNVIHVGYRIDLYAFVDVITIGLAFIAIRGVGFCMWFHELFVSWRRSYAMAH